MLAFGSYLTQVIAPNYESRCLSLCLITLPSRTGL